MLWTQKRNRPPSCHRGKLTISSVLIAGFHVTLKITNPTENLVSSKATLSNNAVDKVSSLCVYAKVKR